MGKKKGGKGKDKGPPVPEEEPTEYDTMKIETLREVIPMLRQQLEKAQIDRNYVQLERDTVDQFYEITKKEVHDLELQSAAKDREMELMSENHRVELKVYMQKVKHLDYEHKNSILNISTEGKTNLVDEHNRHEDALIDHKTTKFSFKDTIKENSLMQIDEVASLRAKVEKNLALIRSDFGTNLQEIEKKYKEGLEALKEDLELRRRVDIHEVEERKNMHINDLMKNHQNAFTEMKTYYNNISRDNLTLIWKLKEDISNMKKKAIENQKLMYDISQENKRLSEPLAIAVAEVGEMQGQLKDREKDRLSLRQAVTRLQASESAISELQNLQINLQQTYHVVERERDELYNNFETNVKALEEAATTRNKILEEKIDQSEVFVEDSAKILQDVIASAQLDHQEVQKMTQSLDQLLRDKQSSIGQLSYSLVKATKVYNDTLKVYEAKLIELGLPQEEIKSMGFEHLKTPASEQPAGLVGC